MCVECGCGKPERFGVQPMQARPAGASSDHWHTHADGTSHSHPHDHDHPHHHDHDHDHPHHHPHDVGSHGESGGARRVVELARPILERNDRLAERNRGYLKAKGIWAVNLVSSPGSGKTTLLEKTLAALKDEDRRQAAVIVGDLATERDARRLRAAGADTVQITTGEACHLDAEMVARGMDQLDLSRCRCLFIENVGNLVCPAAFDLGENQRVALLSVTEGEDKPLKYPVLFKSANVVVVTKLDLAAPAGVDLADLLSNLRAVNPQAKVIRLSARTGDGMSGWLDWIRGFLRRPSDSGFSTVAESA